MKNRLLFLNLIFILALAASCGREVKEDIAVKERIGEIAEKVLVGSTAIPFSLDSLTSYTWEEVYIITPYTQIDRVKHITRADLSTIEETGIEYDDGKKVIAFINNGKLTSYVDLPRGSGDFAYLQDSILLYPFGSAEFRMVNKNGRAVVEKN
ncbi:hypothetical protein H9Q13_10135 [Pontibacter sp. JH31]|uniref:Uncharacterized protein n=1 Tax=Pontibacter aquaedesilientis TaxID=2766980 RepID=A0ABR7XGW5_9BACT|nr:hypothetical protein [Pontibacter aquaedesilientis]MBD1397525.1 hypothetical protein [Pontibacter aquaedesilientis]